MHTRKISGSARRAVYSSLFRKGAAVFSAAAALSFLPQAEAQTPAAADSITNAYNSAFWVASGSNGYYAKDTTKSTAPGADSWTLAEEIEMAIDAYNRSKTSAYLNTVNQLIGYYVAANGTNWTGDAYDDDILWMTIACERAYLITGNSSYASMAQSNFDAVYARGYDTTLGGGIWESTLKKSKTSCANCPCVISACYLYQIYGTSAYLTKAQSIYSWERSTLFNTSTGNVDDNISAAGVVSTSAYTYNQGTFIGAANALYGITSTTSYLNDATLAANYTQNNLCSSGMLPQYSSTGDFAGFNGIFIRWLGIFAQQRGLWGTYYNWMAQNAMAAWNQQRTSDGLSWNDWASATPTGTLQSWACSDAVVMMNVIPPLFELDTLTVQSYVGPDYRIVADTNFRDGNGVILDSTAVGNNIVFVVPDVSARSYDVRVSVKKLNTRGIFQLAIGQAGNNSPNNMGSPQDLYSSSSQYVELDLGTWSPATTGDKWFWFTITGKNASSTGYSECIEYIKLIPQ